MENLTLSNKKLSLFLTNARSLLPKVEDLESTMSPNGVCFAFITETWMNNNINDAAVHIPMARQAGFLGLVEGFVLLLNRTSLLKY
jgi:hypothetical protein